jgi:hypothetical protein
MNIQPAKKLSRELMPDRYSTDPYCAGVATKTQQGEARRDSSAGGSIDRDRTSCSISLLENIQGAGLQHRIDHHLTSGRQEGKSKDMVQKAHKIRTLEELKGRTLEEFLHEVAHNRESITVVLEEGESVTVEVTSHLKPLPELDGRAPEEWKDASY